MTDKEKAEEYMHKKGLSYFDKNSTYKVRTYYMYQAYLDGLAEGRKEVCKKILEEVRTHEGIEQMTKFYIGEIIKELGVDL